MEDLFSQILDKDESILKIYKPHRSRAYLSAGVLLLFFTIWIVLAFVGVLLDPDVETYAWAIFVVLFILIVGITLLFLELWCRKTVYAVTDKRILIRTGYIGVDYKSLNYDMLGAMTVNVGWIDKLFNTNTGNIAFGSMSSPLTNQGGAKFAFTFIKSPYDVYREVKSIIDEHKAK